MLLNKNIHRLPQWLAKSFFFTSENLFGQTKATEIKTGGMNEEKVSKLE